MRAYRTFLVAVLAATLLAGCPFPVPPGYKLTRESLAETVPAFIRPGVTTREDVLMVLGEPDAVAVDETWIGYGSAYGQGGMGVVLAAASSGAAVVVAESVRYRRLVIQFDAQGIVAFTALESDTCAAYAGMFGNASGQSEPCLDIRGRDIPAKYKWTDRRPDTN